MNKEQFFQKGESFERDIITAISTILKNVPHRIFSSLHCECPILHSQTEIDIVIVTSSKIFILEAKSFRSSLEGSLNDSMWIGYSGKYSQKIYNPCYQHKLHLRSLRRAFRQHEYSPVEILDFVVVPNTCNIITDASNVLTLGTFLAILEDILQEKEKYNVEEVSHIIEEMIV